MEERAQEEWQTERERERERVKVITQRMMMGGTAGEELRLLSGFSASIHLSAGNGRRAIPACGAPNNCSTSFQTEPGLMQGKTNSGRLPRFTSLKAMPFKGWIHTHTHTPAH